MNKEIYVGVDIGTDSVGYAVTDSDYNLLKHKGEAMWGATVFESAKTKAERRGFRTSRRRLDRRQQRIDMTQEIFAKEIAKVDDKFFIRINESGLLRKDTTVDIEYIFFNQKSFNDIDFNKRYPTIHHLICDLIENDEAKDVRFVYIAIAWLMAHRGHFLSEVDKRKIDQILNFDEVYLKFENTCFDVYGEKLWDCDKEKIKKVMLTRKSITKKEQEFFEILNNGKKFKVDQDSQINKALVIKLLSGGQCKADKLFLKEDYCDIDSISLGMPEDVFANVVSELDDEGEILLKLREIYDWSLLSDLLAGQALISKAKVQVYEQHKEDLKNLKHFIRKYIPNKYNTIFREGTEGNYASYTGHVSIKNELKKCSKDVFCDFLKKQLKDVLVDEEDEKFYNDMMSRIELRLFLPKQVDGDNRVIPYQLYWHELDLIIKNARNYLSFLNEKDQDGYENAEKIMSIFEFRIPYFVGPLRTNNSSNAWMKRKADGKIYPWCFEEKVDLDASEREFIRRITNKCTYLPGEDVLPKCSLLYQKYVVLNEINCIKVNGVSIDVEVKQAIYRKFMEYKKMSIKKIEEVLIARGIMKKNGDDVISGLDTNIKSSLSSYHAFKNLLESRLLSENDVENIILKLTYSEDKQRIRKWLVEEYTNLSAEDIKYLSRLKINDYGRLSKKLLVGLIGADMQTGEVVTVMDALWNTNNNLMQILNDNNKFTFYEELERARSEYYCDGKQNIESMLDDMYISNSVRRPIYRTLAIIKDIQSATKTVPKRIFIEMARGGGEKGKRTVSRRTQIENLYTSYPKDEVRELSHELDRFSDNELQSEVLFLYFMQMGCCMYSGEKIDINQLKSTRYNVDHIYPQALVKDDSISNKVLVLSELNGRKNKNIIEQSIRNEMLGFWKSLREHNMISDEKFKRLTRSVSFTEEELQGFINRQLVETRQSTKALAEILGSKFPDTEIVYVKAGLVSDFRNEFDLPKSRQINDLHHGKDAFLNIICGNVYHCRFTKNFAINKEYSLKTKTLFTHKVYEGDKCIWSGEESIAKVKRTANKNNLHYTRFAFERKGGLFDQMPVKAGKGSVPRKASLDIKYYGGYNSATASFYLLVKYSEKKKTDIMFMPVNLYETNNVLTSEENAVKYARKTIAEIFDKDLETIEILGFPIGLKKLKVNTILSLDGYKIAITGKSSGGTRFIFTSLESLKVNKEAECYIKKLENFERKFNEKKLTKIDSEYDKINKKENMKLYNMLVDKIQFSKYVNIFGNCLETLIKARDIFNGYEVEKQTFILLNILNIFKTGRAAGCDLQDIGGSKNSAVMVMSAKLSISAKKYNDIRIIDTSASGIYNKESQNLLEFL